MKKILLFFVSLLSCSLFAHAHSIVSYTIYYDDSEISSTDDSNGKWDPNGNVPPQPEADYYINIQNSGNVYYRLVEVDGSSPVEYQCFVPVLRGNFKIYAKEYWTERNTSGYDSNKYIFGSRQEPTGFDHGAYKELGNPGGDLQIEGGGTWYGCEVSFWPTGHTGNGVPDIIITGGQKDQQNITIQAVGTGDGPTTGHIDFTISAAGIVDPTERTYTVTISYTQDGATSKTTVTQEVTGLTGTFENITGLAPSSTTDFDVTVEIKNAPYYDNPAAPENVSGYKDFSASTTAQITTSGLVYLIGNIDGNDWDPQNAIAGTIDESDGSVFKWTGVKLVGERRFRFTSQKADWNTLNANGTQYYPSQETVYINNLSVFDDSWYSYQTGLQTDNAWSPNLDLRATTPPSYDIYFDAANKKVAIAWGLLTVVDEPETDVDKVVSVYNLQGIEVRAGVKCSEAFIGLPSGIYIADGKKMSIK